MHEYYLRLFKYDHWANQECLTALTGAPVALPKALRLIAHTLSAQHLWLERIQGAQPTIAVWPDSTIKDCKALAQKMSSAWKDYLSSLPATGMDCTAEYRNSKGEPWSSRVEDVLIHVLMHSMYHRGQVALEMRAAGVQPAYTDFIHGVRQGFVD